MELWAAREQQVEALLTNRPPFINLSNATTSSPLTNTMQLNALDDLEIDHASEVITMFESDFRAYFATLRAVVRNGADARNSLQSDATHAMLHRLKGDSSTLGMMEVAKLVDQLRAGGDADILLDALRQHVCDGLDALRERLNFRRQTDTMRRTLFSTATSDWDERVSVRA